MFPVAAARLRACMKQSAAALAAVALIGSACGNSTTSPTSPAPATSPSTETLTGTMARNGTAIRTFTAAQAGTVSVTLASAGPPPTIVLGLGLGIRSSTGADCLFTRTVNTPAGSGPQLTAPVDAGQYCAGAYDLGTIGPAGITVSITVTHP